MRTVHLSLDDQHKKCEVDEGSDCEVVPPPLRDHRQNIRIRRAMCTAPSLPSRHGPVWRRDDSASAMTPLFAVEVKSSQPKSSCDTAMPAEDFVRTNAPFAPRDFCDRPGTRGIDRVSETFEVTVANVKLLQRMRWSLNDFSFLGPLGAGRISTVGGVRKKNMKNVTSYNNGVSRAVRDLFVLSHSCTV